MTRRELMIFLLAAVASPAAAGEKADAKKPDTKKGPAGESFVPVAGLSVSVDKGGGRRGVMTLECGLDIPDAAFRTRAQSMLPRVHAAFVAALQIYASGLSPNEPPDFDIIAQQLQRQANITLGRPGARVLLGSLVVN